MPTLLPWYYILPYPVLFHFIYIPRSQVFIDWCDLYTSLVSFSLNELPKGLVGDRLMQFANFHKASFISYVIDDWRLAVCLFEVCASSLIFAGQISLRVVNSDLGVVNQFGSCGWFTGIDCKVSSVPDWVYFFQNV